LPVPTGVCADAVTENPSINASPAAEQMILCIFINIVIIS